MRYYLVAGEASGDLHGSNLMRELQTADPDAEFRFWGGDRMAAVGGTPVRHIRELAFMGFWEVAAHWRTILGLLRQARRDILDWKPDALLLIDYPGFNLRMAKTAKQHGIPVFWYISPQVWAWKANRVHTLKQTVEQLYAILPFEPDFFQRYGMSITYVGHPLLDAIPEQTTTNTGKGATDPFVVLLPGSRKQEIQRMLPVMLELAQRKPEMRFKLAGLSHLDREVYQPSSLPPNVELCMDETYALLEAATAAVVTSGTATLETALFGVPQVVLYRGAALSFWIARRLVNVPYIALVNLILNKPLLTELLQGEAEVERLQAELEDILPGGRRRETIRNGYQELRQLLGGAGASARTARDIQTRLNALKAHP